MKYENSYIWTVITEESWGKHVFRDYFYELLLIKSLFSNWGK